MNNLDKKWIYGAGAVLVGLLVLVTVLLVSEKQVNYELTQEFQLEKEDLENQYTDFAKQYDELRTTIANDSLQVLLEQEQLKTQRLLEELRTVKSTNATEIRRLKKELATLRKVMVSYINQIDSLNQLTARQKEIIADVTQKYNRASQQINTLTEEKRDLDKKVSLAAQLDATGIKIEPRNDEKKAKKMKNVNKFKVDFTIAKNVTAKNGEHIIYVNIVKPNNAIITGSPDNVFTYENRALPYTSKIYLEYTGEEKALTVYCNTFNEYLSAGTYRVDIFADGALIGSEKFEMKK